METSQEHSNNHEHSKDKPNKYAVILILLLSVAGIFFAFSDPSPGQAVKGKVLSVLSEDEVSLPVGNITKQIVEQELLVEIVEQGQKKEINITNDYTPVEKGDKIYVTGSSYGDNPWSMANISRTGEIAILFLFFIALVFMTSGVKGFYALTGLAFTFAVIMNVMVPKIALGASPVAAGIGSAAVILVSTLYLSYGLNKKSIAAFIGIIISLVFVGLIAHYFTGSFGLTGISEASTYLDMLGGVEINMVGLLIAGMIIAAVGVLDDVAVIQSSIVFSLASANKSLRSWALFKEAMRVGKDHISAVVNTLVLAYTGASLPLIMLLSVQGMEAGYFLSLEMVAEEVARTLISSSGLLLAVPLTTLIAVMMIKTENINNLN